MIALQLLLAVPLAAAPVARAQYLMGTVCEITAHGPRAAEAAAAAFEEIARWDRVLSLYKEESEASALNRRAAREAVAVSPALWEAVTLALAHAEASGGAFDPTAPHARRAGLPTAGGWRGVAVDPARRTVRFLSEGLGLDFGGIGKGLALDHAARVMREKGVESAFLNFGGQVYALGAPPGRAGWSVRLPSGEEVVVRDASVSTSGNSERPGHILSPFTGRPLLGERSVTVVARTGAEADAWSTALFVLGPAARTPFAGRAYFDKPAVQGDRS